MTTPLDLVAGLGQNMAMVLAALFLDQQAQPWLQRLGKNQRSVVTGVLFAIIAILGMLVPIRIADGVVIDARVVLVALAGAYGGIPAGVIAAALVCGYRLHLGGIGTLAGILAIIAGSGIGCLFNRLVGGVPANLRYFHHLGLGFATAVAGLLCTFALPTDMAWKAFQLYAVPVLVSYPLGAVMLGGLLALQYRSRADQAELQASRDRLALATRSAGIGVWDWDVVHNRLVWDDNMYRILRVERSTFSGAYEAWAKTVHPDDLARAEAELQAALRERREFNTSFRIVWPDGSIRTIRAVAQTFNDIDGRPSRMVGVNEDITDRAMAEAEVQRYRDHLEELVAVRTTDLEQASQDAERLTQETETARRAAVEALKEAKQLEQSYLLAKDQAEAANRAKSDFLASMSHEIRTPLNAVLGYAQLLARDAALAPGHRRAVEVINRSGEHLLALISDILDMARIESGRSTLDAEDFDLHDLLDNLRSLFHLRAQDKGLNLRLAIAADLPRCVRTDQRKVRQILANLLSNAVKFTVSGSVDLIASHQDGEVHFVVRDTGPGLCGEDLARLFHPFVQISTNCGRRDGSGLGLAISRGFAHTLGGRLTAASDLGKGSSFTLSIPVTVVAHADRMIASRQEAIALAPGTIAPRVLVVEDEPDLRDLLVTLFTEVGIDVRAVSNGAEAVEMCREWQPQLVWMDLTMPVMDGLTATRAIRASPGPQPVIIALTAAAFDGDRPRIQAAGCDAVMHKPYREDDLFTQMESRLGIRFVWRRNAPEKSLSITAGVDDLRAELLVMTASQRAELLDAVVTGDTETIRQLIEALPASEIRQGLLELVEHFALDRLQALLESTDPTSTSPT